MTSAHPPSHSSQLTEEKRKEIWDRYDSFLFDCDGVLWRGDEPISGASELLTQLRSRGKRVVFVSNNSTAARHAYVKKFTKQGLEAKEEEIFSSAFAAGAYLSTISPDFVNKKKKVYVIGEAGICQELAAVGIEWLGSEHDKGDFSFDEVMKMPLDPDVGAVVVGLDRHLNYRKLAAAQGYLLRQSPPCLFIATNTDTTFPAPNRLAPGTGSIVAAVATSTHREPVVLGKPNSLLLDLIIQQYHLERSKTLMIGDRLDTDIAFGKRGGLSTLLVLSGVSNEKDIQKTQDPAAHPDYIANSVADLLLSQ